MSSKSSGRYIFRKHDSIGANAAENDEAFLKLCFEDTGDLEILLNPDRPERIILGRTGSGKSALLLKLQERAETVIAIEPENLSLNYIANSTIIRFLHDLGVNLDPFYKLLWRHVLSVTLLQERFGITDELAKRTFIERLLESSERKRQRQIEADRRKKALAYIERWGESFWADAEYRTKEVTTKFETEVEKNIKSSIGIDVGGRLSTLVPKLSGNREQSSGDSTTLSLEEPPL